MVVGTRVTAVDIAVAEPYNMSVDFITSVASRNASSGFRDLCSYNKAHRLSRRLRSRCEDQSN